MAEIVLVTDVSLQIGYSKYAGTYRIATELRQNHFNVKVIDLFSFHTEEILLTLVKKYVGPETLFVGFSTTFFRTREDIFLSATRAEPLPGFIRTESDHCPSQFANIFPHKFQVMMALFFTIRERNPRTKIVVGGSWSVYRQNYPGVDFWVMGLADASVVALARHLKYGESLKAQALCESGSESLILHSDYPYADFSTSKIVWDRSDHLFPGEVVPIEIARGCVFKCSFCGYELNGKKPGDWLKTREILREELLENYEKYGITSYLISDDTINDSLSKVKMLHEVFTSLPFEITWNGYLRLDLIHRYPEMREMLLEMGARAVIFGIETLNENAGRMAGKGLGKKRTLETLHWLAEKWNGKVLMHSGFIVGLPGEPESSMMETFDWLISDENPLTSFSIKALAVTVIDNFSIYKQKMADHPERYQMKLTGKVSDLVYHWEHSEMDFYKALKIVESLNSNEKMKKRQKFPVSSFSWSGRLVNIGYTYDEILSSKRNPGEWQLESFERTQVKKLEYQNAILRY